MSDITRAEFDALVQKVDEIHWMLKSRQPFVVPSASTSEQTTVNFGNPQPDPWHFPAVPSKTTGGTNGQ
jgi:hypothetical protein